MGKSHGPRWNSMSLKQQKKAIARATKWNLENPEKRRVNWTRYRIKLRTDAVKTVAGWWGDDHPRCRVDSIPQDHPLVSHKCLGQLQIDHMNGDGKQESGNKLYQNIRNGNPRDDLRILCTLHNLWNWKGWNDCTNRTI